MLSYRHGFHAGNHADVLKHWVQVLCVQYMKNKDKPFVYLDTHSGAGTYSLTAAQSQKTGEAQQGIGRLWQQQKQLAESLADYLGLLQQFNGLGLKHYPGSPLIAQRLLRPEDQLRLVEMHANEFTSLQRLMVGDRRVKVIRGDGFQQLKALLPPQCRRALILIDPSYEVKTDYPRLIQAMNEALKRFATGVYLIWYPMINSVSAQRFSEQLRKLPCEQWLDVRLQVSSAPSGHGLYGSGVFVVNPPWVLRDELDQGLPDLVRLLSQDEVAGYSLQMSDN